MMTEKTDGCTELISVIVPIYKVEKYLEECVESILGQTYTALEVLLVDDGSPDRCGEIADRYAADDSRVKVIHQENQGLSEARNSGLRAASGAWIVFVDSDDVIHKDMIRILYDAAVSTESDLAWCAIREFPENDFPVSETEEVSVDIAKKANESEAVDKGEITLLSRQEAEKQLYTMSGNQQCLVAWNKLYRRSLFWEEGEPIVFPKGKIYEDGYTTYRLIYQAGQVAVVPRELYYYRQRTGSIMKKNSYQVYEPALDAGLLRMAFYEKYGEKELYKMELNLTIYSVIRFYAAIKDRQERKNLRKWFVKIYYDYFVKEKWTLAKRIRMRAFLLGYPCYRMVSSFEGLYNRLNHNTK